MSNKLNDDPFAELIEGETSNSKNTSSGYNSG